MLFGCASYHPGSDGSINFSGLCDPALDARMQAVADSGDAAGWAAIDREITDRAPFAVLFNPTYIDVTSRRVDGFFYHEQYNWLIGQRAAAPLPSHSVSAASCGPVEVVAEHGAQFLEHSVAGGGGITCRQHRDAHELRHDHGEALRLPSGQGGANCGKQGCESGYGGAGGPNAANRHRQVSRSAPNRRDGRR